jgi:hypothetical protein
MLAPWAGFSCLPLFGRVNLFLFAFSFICSRLLLLLLVGAGMWVLQVFISSAGTVQLYFPSALLCGKGKGGMAACRHIGTAHFGR